ncbi:unnamed protein product, partial [Prorocentrum cordatum]
DTRADKSEQYCCCCCCCVFCDCRPLGALAGGDWGHSSRSPTSGAWASDDLLQLLRGACAALGWPPGGADRWAAQLAAEWVVAPRQLPRLTPAQLARLGLPRELQAELLRGLPAAASGH